MIIQDDIFDTDSVTICPFTTDPTEAPLFRLAIQGTDTNGLKGESRVMIDKITTITRLKFGELIGVFGGADLFRIGRAMVVFLGMRKGVVLSHSVSIMTGFDLWSYEIGLLYYKTLGVIGQLLDPAEIRRAGWLPRANGGSPTGKGQRAIW